MAGGTQEHDDPDSAYRRFERSIEWPMLVLSIGFVALLLLPELLEVDRQAIDLAMGIIWAAFAAEVLVLAVLAPSKRRMLREHWIDVLIVAAPFLRPLRVGRLLQVLRAGGPIGRAMQSVHSVIERRGLQVYGAITIGLISGSAVLVYGLEKDADGSNITGLADAIWWAMVTTTTVGYGDHFPITPEGQAIAVVLMFVGIGLVGVVTANVAAYFVETERASELDELRQQLDRIEARLAADS